MMIWLAVTMLAYVIVALFLCAVASGGGAKR